MTFIADPSTDSDVLHRIMVDGKVYMSVDDIVAVVDQCAAKLSSENEDCDTACLRALSATFKMYR